MNKLYTTATGCRVCGGGNLEELFGLGDHHLSDFVPLHEVKRVPTVPLVLDRCPACGLVQQRHAADPALLYRKGYWYRSGTTATMRAALAGVVDAARRLVQLRPGDVVLDIGSNDGTLLDCWAAHGMRNIIGVEPAPNFTTKHGAIKSLWGTEEALAGFRFVAGRSQAKVITACGMMYDLDDPHEFVRHAALALASDGVLIAQLMCLRQMLAAGDVGNLCHEHLEFYTLRSLVRLFGKHGLEVFDLEQNDVNGGSYRLYVRHENGLPRTQALEAAMAVEAKITAEVLRAWFVRAGHNRDRCVTFIRQEVAAGKRVWVYGASTKGNTILQWYDLGGRTDDDMHQLLVAAADRDPKKWGLYTAGTGVPIHSEEEFRRDSPDYALVLPYAFMPEFTEREAEWRSRGGKFIVPLPELRIL